jgi:hypothetical protein
MRWYDALLSLFINEMTEMIAPSKAGEDIEGNRKEREKGIADKCKSLK